MAETKSSVTSNITNSPNNELTPLNRVASAASEQEQDSKRQRTSPGKNSPTTTAPKDEREQEQEHEHEHEQEQEKARPQPEDDLAVKPAQKPQDAREARRKSGVTDEKQRSKRLFGALLGNLNQPGDRVSRRRSEIEQRRKAELQKQDDERLEDRQKRLEKLAVQRKKEQINVDEQNMHIRHKNMLKNANFLQTKAEPRLYYKPWELLTDEEDRIDDQIKDTEDQIDKELADWEDEKKKRLESLNGPEGDPANKAPDSKPEAETAPDEGSKDTAAPEQDASGDSADKHVQDAPTNNPTERRSEVPESDPGEHTNGDEPKPASTGAEEPKPEGAKSEDPTPGEPIEEEKKEDNEDDGDHVVEGDEDDVIY
ncbi:hypothetical protein M409DRAFT_63453 [Zasmidium cellare ATCC 36951]|uniref:Pinin/SDK/MemA protein domain-containing protein n=1 Tax=Zasmidium cellare ATCC 36951 TaxID=1080233 RepID=A0A6A6CYT2_ZASCE|nr:uncharacterized protein M409DRAFT_63453 [Zasmidium cellare ATCC 36951]KAF2171913.1 hypothetical protein M409DRAFT_63453 [Zasmidium cellare ATCC 36951]